MKKNKWKKITALLLACLIAIQCSSFAFAYTNPFEDVSSNSWFYNAVMYVNGNGLMTGKDPSHFAPEEYMQRQDVAVVLARHFQSVGGNVDLSGPSDPYYANYIKWAKEKQIMMGYANGNFGVGDYITREAFVTVLYRYKSIGGIDPDPSVLDTYSDLNKISDYAKLPMDFAIVDGIIQGYEKDGVKTIDPQGFLTRAMAAQIMERFFDTYGD